MGCPIIAGLCSAFASLLGSMISGAYVSSKSLTCEFEKIVGDAETPGARLIGIAMLPLDAMRSLGEVQEFCDASDEMAGCLADHGIELCYHNHHIEFSKYEGLYLLEVLTVRAPRVRP